MSARRQTLAERRRAAISRNGELAPLLPPTGAFMAALAAVAAMVLVGLVMVLSASSIVAINNGGSPWNMFRRQLLWAAFGLLAGLATYRMPYRVWGAVSLWFLALTLGMMVLPFVPGVGVTVNGARAWVEVSGVGFQPSEALKVGVVVYLASLLGRRQSEAHDPKRVFRPAATVWGLAACACLAQRDVGAAIVFTCIVVAMMFMAGVPVRLVAGLVGASLAGAAAVVATSERLQGRFFAFLNLEESRADQGYQVWQSILSISNGGILGTGAGEGTSKWGYVPLAHSDFIFAVVAEEFGLIGSTIVLGGFLVLLGAGLRASLRAADAQGALLAGGITAWLCIQAAINIGGVVGAMPVTGLTLPFISYGGSSLFAVMTASGLLLNVARHPKS